MELNNKLTVSASPHVKSAETTTGIMLDVIIALLPAGIASIFVFGIRALLVIAVSVASCVLAEYLSRKAMKRDQTIGDLSAVVTGLLLAYNLPSTIPVWEVIFGAIVAIVVVKQMFGGIGQNFVNPALLARIVLISAFPSRMSAGAFVGTNVVGWDVDGVTGATPMGLISLADGIKDGAPSLMHLFLGTTAGCIGEVSALALLLGGIYLIIRKVISPIIPCVYIGTVALIMLIAFGDVNAMLYEVLGGGLMIGAIFMATDYTTSPITDKGKIIYALGCGLLTCLIRLFGSLPEGVSFSIIIMNILVPHIENWTKPTIFGTVKEKKEKKEAAE
ncbi:MAG: RnfABCDGE type electron transport complex subunit D [Clostridia bacterium]|nr:RnfABCDGE type electron transport complex subunit D [Clostridia bacterium]MBR5976720.1 RnfABCDGE type electron transport complex subunit D [Clostridia bacterium]MBR6479786.1 RnfABCDGE type electron transport complex subunit D [Clostridia bacterium]MBR6511975.1 RnfABCDGE type electron transport complex subunit D [Clostridia bacterium]